MHHVGVYWIGCLFVRCESTVYVCRSGRVSSGRRREGGGGEAAPPPVRTKVCGDWIVILSLFLRRERHKREHAGLLQSTVAQ